jgi:hypothetical protein
MREEYEETRPKRRSYNLLVKFSVILIFLAIAREVLRIGTTLLLPFIFSENAWLSILLVPFILFIWLGVYPVCRVLWRMLR